MKCPHCNFEREEDFNFCPICGLAMRTVNNNSASFNQPPYNQPNYPPQGYAPNNNGGYYYPQYVYVQQPVMVYPHGLDEKTYKERKELKLASRLIGGSFLSLLIISGFIASFIVRIMGIAGIDSETIYNIFTDPYFLQFFQITASTLMFTVPFIIFFKCGKQKISKLINFSLPKTKDWFPIVLMGVGFCSFANIAGSIASSFFDMFGVEYYVDFGENPEGFFGITLSIIATAITPALVEEFACRGIMLGALRKFGDGFAIMVSSILFGVVHGNFQQMPFAFLVGLIMGFVTVKCESIWPAILIHFYNNLSSVIFDYVFMGVEVGLQNVIYTIYLMICLFIGILGVLLLRNNTEVFKFAPTSVKATTKQKYTWFFTTELVIIVLSICLFDSLQYFVG